MREVSYNELFNNIQCDYSIFFEDDFAVSQVDKKTILYRMVHMDKSLIIRPMLTKLQKIDNGFAASLEEFVDAFFEVDISNDDWNEVVIDDIETALDIIKEKNEEQYLKIKGKYDAIALPESRDVKSVLHQFGTFGVVPNAYGTIFKEYICCGSKWKPFYIYTSYSIEIKNELKELLSGYPESPITICCYIDNNLGGENKAEQIVNDLVELGSSEKKARFIGAVVTSRGPFRKINDNIFIDYVNKTDMSQLKSALLRSIYHYFLHSLKEQYVAGINKAFSKAGNHRNIALYLTDMANIEGMSNYSLLLQWLSELTDYYFSQSDDIEKMIAIANLIERNEEESRAEEDSEELSDINTFEAFDSRINNYFQPIEPGDVFITDDRRIFVAVGQACEMAISAKRKRRNGLCELVAAELEVNPCSIKIINDEKSFRINHFKIGEDSGVLKINYQTRFFIENEVLDLSSFNSDGCCKIDLKEEPFYNPILQQYQLDLLDNMKKYFKAVVNLKEKCDKAASLVLANESTNWLYSLLDYSEAGGILSYPIRRICRLKEKYLLYLYKLFLEYRGRIPFNTINMNNTVLTTIDFTYKGIRYPYNVTVLTEQSNCDIKVNWPYVITNVIIKDLLDKAGDGLELSEEQEKYIIKDSQLEVALIGGKLLKLKKVSKKEIVVKIE